MSGMQYLPLSINEVFPDHMTNAEKAGMRPEQVKDFYDLVAGVAKSSPLSYDEVEREMIKLWSYSQQEKVMKDLKENLNAIKTATVRKAQMRESAGETGRYTQRGHKSIRSSKGKFPGNFTPPKKNRK